MSEIKNIKNKLKRVSELLTQLEDTLSSVGNDISEIESNMIKVVRKLVDLYYIIIDYMSQEEDIYRLVGRDDIKAWIIKVLYQYGKLNILQITKAVRNMRGKASRRIIAKKLNELERMGLVKKEIKGRSKIYYLNIK